MGVAGGAMLGLAAGALIGAEIAAAERPRVVVGGGGFGGRPIIEHNTTVVKNVNVHPDIHNVNIRHGGPGHHGPGHGHHGGGFGGHHGGGHGFGAGRHGKRK